MENEIIINFAITGETDYTRSNHVAEMPSKAELILALGPAVTSSPPTRADWTTMADKQEGNAVAACEGARWIIGP